MPCFYCNTSGHTIRRCNSPQIVQDYNTIKRYYDDRCNNNIFGRTLFINYVDCTFTTRGVKAICLKYIGRIQGEVTQRNLRKNYMIEKLWEHFDGSLDSSDSSHSLGYGLPCVPDEVPAYAQDLLTWTIDRTPDATPDANDDIPLYQNTSLMQPLNDTIRDYLLIEEMSFREDEYIPIYPINLMQEFDAVATKTRKYNINLHLEQHLTKEETEEDCIICYELTKDSDKVYLNCGHKFCGKCIKGCFNAGAISCAMCRCSMKNIIVKKQEIYELVSEYCN